MSVRFVRPLLAAAVLALVAPASLSAQRVVIAEAPSRGWLGIEYVQETLRGESGARPVARITNVEPGSPAESAGLAANDTILTVNDIAASQQLLASLAHSLSPGESVRLRVQRDGRTRDVTVVTAERPEGHAMPQTYRIDMDAIRGRARVFLDSALVQLDSVRLPTVIFELPEGRGSVITPEQLRNFGGSVQIDTIAPGRIRIRAFGGDWPRGEHLDSLARSLSLMGDHVVRGIRLDSLDGRIRLLRADTMLRAELDSVTGRLSRAYVLGEGDAPRGFFRAAPGGATFEGVSFFATAAVAGAQLADVDPAMESYFGTADGVLVLRVAPETPAARAGLIPGDIILGINDARVASTAELRRRVATVDGPIRLEVLRERRSLHIELPRE